MPKPKPEHRQRRWAPKLRSGCATCKKRKKRCDEKRPVCQRCIDGKYICDGYETSSSKSPPGQNDTHLKLWHKASSTSTSQALLDHTNSQSHWDICSNGSYNTRNETNTILLNECLNAVLSVSDQKYAQFFVVRVAPIIATTEEWHLFWESTVPQASIRDSSVHHAMVALSATYEALSSGTDRRTEIMKKVNLAARAALSHSVCTDDVLIVCRLLAAIFQCTGDWKLAINHLQHGWRILMEGVRNHQINSPVAQLLAPTFLCASTDEIGQLQVVGSHDPLRSSMLEFLERIRSQYMAELFSVPWRRTHEAKREIILTAWSMMTQASCSILYSGTLASSLSYNIVSVQDIETNLARENDLLSFEELETKSISVFQDVAAHLQNAHDCDVCWVQIKQQLQSVVENILVQAAKVEPMLKVSSFWHEDANNPCDIDNYLSHHEVRTQPPQDLCIFKRDDTRGDNSNAGHQMKAHYLEFVCPYRSGFTPAYIKWK